MRTYEIEGIEYPSVTTVLGVLDKPGLNVWLRKQAVKAALRGGEPKDAPKRELNKAIQRGNRVHKYASDYSLGDIREPIDEYEEAAEKFFMDIKPIPFLSEHVVFHPLYGFAGTTDMIAKIGKDTWVLEFKTGKNIYPEAHLQVSAYGNSVFYIDSRDNAKRPMPYIRHYGVVLFTASGEYIFKEVENSFTEFLAALKLWKWKRKW